MSESLQPCGPAHQTPVHRVLQARIPGVAMSSNSGASQPKCWTHMSFGLCIDRQVFTISTTWEAHGITVRIKYFLKLMCLFIHKYSINGHLLKYIFWPPVLQILIQLGILLETLVSKTTHVINEKTLVNKICLIAALITACSTPFLAFFLTCSHNTFISQFTCKGLMWPSPSQ